MEDAGFILGGYLLTFSAVALMSWRVLRVGKRLGKRVPDAEKPWL